MRIWAEARPIARVKLGLSRENDVTSSARIRAFVPVALKAVFKVKEEHLVLQVGDPRDPDEALLLVRITQPSSRVPRIRRMKVQVPHASVRHVLESPRIPNTALVTTERIEDHEQQRSRPTNKPIRAK